MNVTEKSRSLRSKTKPQGIVLGPSWDVYLTRMVSGLERDRLAPSLSGRVVPFFKFTFVHFFGTKVALLRDVISTFCSVTGGLRGKSTGYSGC